MVRWSDGLVGGLIAGVISALFFIIVCQQFDHERVLGDYFVRFAMAVFGSRAAGLGPLALLFGIFLYFIAAAIFGILYGLVAANFKPMWKAPTSALCGITYGFVMYFVVEDVIVPVLGVSSYQPLWEGLVGNVLFHGIVISEYITIAFRRNVTAGA
jgi:hypothetical protein